MKFLGNVIWFLLGGFIIAIIYYLVGLLLCVTVIGIPWGVQHFKMAIGALFPFGKVIR